MSEFPTLAAALEAEAERLLELAGQVRALEANGVVTNGEVGRILSAKEVVKLTGLSRSAVYRLAREGQLGAIKLGLRGVGFTERGLAEWQRQGRAL